MNMKKILINVLFFVILMISVFAQKDHDFTQSKHIIDSGVGCSELTDEPLEEIGDYYMEQMHPGEAHEIMDNMMGGKGSESLEQVHINMARRLYCNEGVYVGYEMMQSGRMMGNYLSSYDYGYGNYVRMLIFIALIGVIWWLSYKFGIKKSTETSLGILKKRFAKGEITKKQFDDIKKEMGE